MAVHRAASAVEAGVRCIEEIEIEDDAHHQPPLPLDVWAHVL